MNKKIGIICFVLSLLLFFGVGVKPVYASENDVYLGGMPAGFSLSTRGTHVVGICDVITESGLESPAKAVGVDIGDVILKIDDTEINNAADIEKSIKCGKTSEMEIMRGAETIIKTIKPARDLNGCYKLGVFVKDNVSGIGTVTFIKGNRFASLGHPVLDSKGDVLKIINGNLYNCNVTGVVKGEKGKAGELRGVFLRKNAVASIDKNLCCGVYGVVNDNIQTSKLRKIETGDAKMGDATIYTTVDGCCPKEYDISIVKVDVTSDNKNFVVKITDEDLLEKTGGIVQGMSGSPIVQNGKLVGAITHVFINDPTRGFGITIKNMIDN